MTIINAPIVAITVFVNRARVTRRGTVRLSQGEQNVVITYLPQSLDPDSVRASGTGAGVKILGVDLLTKYMTATPDVDTAALQQQLDALRDQDLVLTDQDASLADRLALLKALRDNSGARFAKALSTGKANIDTFKPLAEYLTTELSQINASQREIARLRRDLAKQIAALELQLTQARSTTSHTWKEIQVVVEASTETDLNLEVMYSVSNAEWEPIYDIRLVDDRVELTYLAQVSQQSGEDWPAVQLTLSTARPAASLTIPKLSTWYVDRYVPPPPNQPMVHATRMAAAPAPSSRAVLMEDRPSSYGAGAYKAEIEQAEVESTGAAVTYHVLRPVAIPSDGSPHKTSVTMLNLDASLDYVVVPKLTLDAYLRARIKNSSSVMLLPGKAQIFHGTDFVGGMEIRRVIAPGEEFETHLGIEDRVKIEYTLMERATAKTLIGNTRRLTVGYKIKLTNNMPVPAHFVVYDQLPVSRYEDIKVKLLDAPTKPVEQTDLNILKWEFDLPAQTTREIPYTFSLEHPRDLAITGLGYLETRDT